MLECLEFRNEKNPENEETQQYGKFSFSQLEKGQGLTVANTLRRVLLYELPAVGITSVLIRNSISNSSDGLLIEDSHTPISDSVNTGSADAGVNYVNPSGNVVNSTASNFLEKTNSESSLFSEIASSHHEFSTLPGVKESVLEILFNLKSVVFENIFPYSSIQKGSLKLSTLHNQTESPEKISGPIPSMSGREYTIRASQLILPSEIRVVHPNQIIATLISPETRFELEFTIEKITQSDLTSTSAFSGRAPNRSTRNRRILPIDGTVFPVKKVNYTIEQDSFGKEIIFFEVWTSGALHPREAVFQSIEKIIKLFRSFQE